MKFPGKKLECFRRLAPNADSNPQSIPEPDPAIEEEADSRTTASISYDACINTTGIQAFKQLRKSQGQSSIPLWMPVDVHINLLIAHLFLKGFGYATEFSYISLPG